MRNDQVVDVRTAMPGGIITGFQVLVL